MPDTTIKTEYPGVSADLRKEYVSGGGWQWLSDAYRTLPPHIDDVTADFGSDLYDRMMYDGQVAAAINLVKLAILSQGIKVVNPKAQEDPDYKASEEITDFIRRNIDRLPRGLDFICFEMLDALAFGNKVAEKVFELGSEGDDVGKLMLKDIKVKPRNVVSFIVDAYLNIIAILGLNPTMDMPPTGNIPLSLVGDYSIGNVLPREKFWVFAPFIKDGDPRGTSMLRPAYNAWWLKTQVWPEYLKYLAQFAGPSLIGYTAEGSVSQPAMDAEGNPVLDSNGNTITVTPEQVMLSALISAKNGTALAFPHGSEVNPLEMNGDGVAFLSAIRLLNEEITKAILYQTLATGDSMHMARAASQTHQDVLNLVIRYGKLSLARTLQTDVIMPLVVMNYGQEKAQKMCPQIQLPEMEIEDFQGNATAIATLFSVGYVDDSQLPSLDAKMNMPIRDMAAWKKKQEQIQATALAAKQPQTPGKPAPKEPAAKKGGDIPNTTDPGSLTKKD